MYDDDGAVADIPYDTHHPQMKFVAVQYSRVFEVFEFLPLTMHSVENDWTAMVKINPAVEIEYPPALRVEASCFVIAAVGAYDQYFCMFHGAKR